MLFKSVIVSFDHNLSAAAVLEYIFESMFKGAASSLHIAASLPVFAPFLPEKEQCSWVMDRSGNDYPR
jgi:hypothetical protein